MADVKDDEDLADEGAVVLLLDVGDQQVEGARALNRRQSLKRTLSRSMSNVKVATLSAYI